MTEWSEQNFISQLKKNEVDGVAEILGSAQYKPEHRWPLCCAWLSLNYKASQVKIYEPGAKSSLADFIVLVTVQNTSQAHALSDVLVAHARLQKIKVVAKEGHQLAQWILIDYGTTLVHLFLPETRDIYALDELYVGFPSLTIPEHFYHTTLKQNNDTPHKETNSKNWNDYF